MDRPLGRSDRARGIAAAPADPDPLWR